MKDELPEGWDVVKLPEVCQLNPGKPDASRVTGDTQVTFVPMAAVDAELGQITKPILRAYTEVSKGFTAFQENDVIMAKITPCMENGKAAIARGLSNGIGFGSTEFHVLRHSRAILPEYLFYFIRQDSFRGSAEASMTGSVGQKRVPLDFLRDTVLPLPPTNEQLRIVAKLEKLLSGVDAAQSRLATLPRILKRFRQSVLAAACSGRLTADWREKTGNEEQDDLPSGWKRTAIEELLPKNGIFDGPFGSNLKTSDYTPSGVRVIRLENIGHLDFIEEKQTYISEEKYKTLLKHTVQKGDIIFASFIADEIRACVLPRLDIKAVAKADCFCLRPKSDLVDRAYLTYQLVSQETFNALINNVHGATRPRINTTQLRRLKVRICPFPEQQEIVRRVEALFKTADALEARYHTAKTYVDKLTQSILAKAFRGELVPQDPNDEPASALIENIRQQSSGHRVNKRGKKAVGT